MKQVINVLTLFVIMNSTSAMTENRFLVGQPCSLLADSSFKDAMLSGISSQITGAIGNAITKIVKNNTILTKDCFGLNKLAHSKVNNVQTQIDSRVKTETKKIEVEPGGLDAMMKKLQSDIILK